VIYSVGLQTNKVMYEFYFIWIMSAERKQISHQVRGMQIVTGKSLLFLNASKIRCAALPKNKLYQCSTCASYIELSGSLTELH